MSDIADKLITRYELKLENGTIIGYRRPHLNQLVILGLIPLGVVSKVKEQLADGEQPSPVEVDGDMAAKLAQYEQDWSNQQRAVALMVLDIDHEPVSLTPEETLDIPPEAFLELLLIGIRAKEPNQGEA
jgi:hypothetical protein